MPGMSQKRTQITVHKVPDGCSLGHKEGETWVMTNKTPEGICQNAYAALGPYIRMLRYGGGSGGRNYARVSCPDYNHCVVWEIKRLDD